MPPLGLVETSPSAVELPSQALALSIDHVLVADQRLWLRGRLRGAPAPDFGKEVPWWQRWRRPARDVATMLHLETEVSGRRLEASVPLASDGHFEAQFTADLPPARRGWRMTRNRVVYQG